MKEFIDAVIEYVKIIAANNNPVVLIMLASSIVILESIIPILPLAIFVALNMILLGNVVGFIVSWLATVIGCVISFTIFRKGLSKYLYGKYKMPGVETITKKISKMSFTTLVLITALPFTPAFSINIAAGLSKMSYKKFIPAMLIAKISIIYFWGFIGKNLLESITDINTLLKIALVLLIGYLISHLIREKFNIE